MKGFVYLFRAANGLYKIGSSVNPAVRLLQINTMSPVEIVEVFSFFCEFRIRTEVLLHERFAAKRVRGEWFLLDDDDVKAFIAASAEYATEAENQYAVDEVHQAKLAYKEFVKSPEYQAHLLECVNRAFGK